MSLRALITGVAGFAGGHLVEHLGKATDWEIWGNVRDATDLQYVVPGVRAVVADLRATQVAVDLIEQCRPDFVFHLAAQPFVPQSWVDPWDTFETNLRSQVNLFNALLSIGASTRVLVIGSNEEYGSVRPDQLPLREDSALRPDSPYGVSKVAQDFMGLQYYLSHKLPVVRVRPFNHIGPRQSDKFVASGFARQVALIEAGLASPVLKVGNLSAQRDFTDVRDMVRAYRLAVTQGEPGEVYNLGSGTPRSVQHLLDVLLGLSQAAIRVEIDPERLRPSDAPISYCDASKFNARTGWAPEIPFQRTLQDVLDDWRNRVKDRL
ncbi:MAG TPA: GDP-mannose 4,6-dehydratase [Anaerolineae bacterium]|nr:GDP-mannose 4,6-dehydratase [Anaerolineae bacterium]